MLEHRLRYAFSSRAAFLTLLAEALDPTEYLRRVEAMVDQILSDSPEPSGPLTDDQIKYLCNTGLHKIVKIMFNRRSRYETMRCVLDLL